MHILIADDDDVSRLELESLLARHGHEVVSVTDGTEAWELLRGDNPPRLVILDWLMEQMDGVEVCRRVRESPALQAVYLILLTSRGDKEHILAGLQAGANDYVTKPFDREELLARVRVGAKIVGLQTELAARVHELEDALARVKQLHGLLPICSYCKCIRDDQNYWHQLEAYVKSHSEAVFSHGICPSCWEKVVKPQLMEQGLRPRTRILGRFVSAAFLFKCCCPREPAVGAEFDPGPRLVRLSENWVVRAQHNDPGRGIGRLVCAGSIHRERRQRGVTELRSLRAGQAAMRYPTARAVAAALTGLGLWLSASAIPQAKETRRDRVLLVDDDADLRKMMRIPGQALGSLVSAVCAGCVDRIGVRGAAVQAAHRPALSHARAVKIITTESDSQFDPILLAAFVAGAPRFEGIYQTK